MAMIEFGGKEMAYLLLALRNYEHKLSETVEPDMGDAGMDLIFIQALIKRVAAANGEA
jgi:hypothetical protein